MCVFYKLMHFVLFTFSLFFTLNLFAQSQCQQNFSLTGNVTESSNGSVRGSRSKKSMDRIEEVGPVIYPQFDKEVRAVKKGFKEEMFQGLDEAYKIVYLAEHLRKLKINPYKTHIVDFSDQISERIRFIQGGMRKNGNKADEKLKTLDQLALEAEKKQKEKKVTYAWWLKWNNQLIALLSIKDDEYLQLANAGHIKFFIKYFPDFIILPTLEDLGIMAMNKFTSENVFPLGFVDKVAFADGIGWTPYSFFDHDINHARSILRTYINNGHFLYGRNSSITSKEFYKRIQGLPTAQQLQAEIVYFLTTHEEYNLYDVYSEIVFKPYFLNDRLWRVLPKDVRRSQKQTALYLKKARRVYKKLLRQDKFWLKGWPVF